MLKARSFVLKLFAIAAFFVFSVTVFSDVSPYHEGHAHPYNTLADRADVLPVSISMDSAPRSRDFLNFSTDYGLGGLWRSTAALRERSVLLRAPYDELFSERSGFSAQLFVDACTDRTRVFREMLNPYFIKSSVGAVLNNDALLEELEKISFSREDAGILFSGRHVYKGVGFCVELPVYTAVSHPWAPSTTRDMLAGDGSGGGSAIIKKITKLGWVAGFGDLKLSVVTVRPLLGERLFGLLGVEGIFPLQSAVGSTRTLTFNPVADNFNPTQFDLLIDQEQAAKYVNRLIDLIKSIGVNPSIGQKSWSLGVLGGFQLYVHPTCTMHTVMQVIYNMPVKEYRLIHRFLDDARTVGSLAVEPGEFLVTSSRGIIFRGMAGIKQKISKNITLGLFGDLFWQNNEKIREVFTDGENLVRLLRGYAEMGSATQVALRGRLEKQLNLASFPNGAAQFSIDASGAISSAGIGKLWHVDACFSVNF